tara:strand:- start:4110 stop:5708 length:1599 start_codon:yes stop_codon:yes gene_type:complete
MFKIFIHTSDLTEEAKTVPGVWESKRGRGGRIPLNAAEMLGIPMSSGGAAPVESVQKLIRSAAFYSWVEGILMDHQFKILQHSLDKEGFHAWSPPGSGKTLCGLIWLAKAYRQPKIVVTKAAARGTWKEEIRKFTRFHPKVLSGKKNAKNRIYYDPRVVYITAWETLIDWKDAILQLGPHSLVMDEIHWAKNHKRVKPVLQQNGKTRFDSLPNTAAAIMEISKAAERRFGLTATPIPNRTRDLWAQLDLAEPWAWGSFHDFGVRYCGGFQDTYGWKYNDLSNAEELRSRLGWCRYKTDQKAVSENLPAKRRQIVYLDREEQNRPSSIKKDLKKAQGDRESVFEVMLYEAASRKRKYVIDRVLEATEGGQKVVVFTGRRTDCDRLGKDIGAKLSATKVPVFCAHGGTTAEKRDTIRHEYMRAEGAAVLVGTGDAWGESVNLQDTDLALFVMIPWTPRSVRQWEGRFSRLGQKRPVLVSYVIAKGTVDEHVADILLSKLPAVGAVAEDETMEEIESAFDGEVDDLLARISQESS